MRKINFEKNKYGKELLVDVGRIEEIPKFIITPELHLLTFYDVMIITEGSGFFSIDDERKAFQKGSVIISLPHQIRKWETKSAVKGLVFFFEGVFLNEYFADEVFLNRFAIFDYNHPTFHFMLNDSDLAKCTWVFEELVLEFDELKGDSSHILRSLVYYIISLLDRIYRENLQLSTSSEPFIIHRFKQLLNQKIRQWHTVNEYAKAMQISHNHLNKYCKKHLNSTALKLIHDRLFLEAKRELTFSTHTISEIAYELNFSDVSNFNRFFKRLSGQSPKQYKHSNLTNLNEN
ncbi:MAG: AraC family transcriptional regulator [Bacteroidota bacterium]